MDSPWGHKESDTTEHACTHIPCFRDKKTEAQRCGREAALKFRTDWFQRPCQTFPPYHVCVLLSGVCLLLIKLRWNLMEFWQWIVFVLYIKFCVVAIRFRVKLCSRQAEGWVWGFLVPLFSAGRQKSAFISILIIPNLLSVVSQFIIINCHARGIVTCLMASWGAIYTE